MADKINFNPECMKSCPQVGACARRALVEHMVEGTPLNEAFRTAVDDARAEGILPSKICEDGPVRAALRDRSSRRYKELTAVKGASAQVVGVIPSGHTIVRVCSAEFDTH